MYSVIGTPVVAANIIAGNNPAVKVEIGTNVTVKVQCGASEKTYTGEVLAIELMNAAQGIEFRRPLKTSPVLERFLANYRKEVPFVKDDIVMYKEIHKTVAFLNRTKFDW